MGQKNSVEYCLVLRQPGALAHIDHVGAVFSQGTACSTPSFLFFSILESDDKGSRE